MEKEEECLCARLAWWKEYELSDTEFVCRHSARDIRNFRTRNRGPVVNKVFETVVEVGVEAAIETFVDTVVQMILCKML